MTRELWLGSGVVVELHANGLPTIVMPNARRRLQLGFGTVLVLCEVARLNAEGRGIPITRLDVNSDLLHLLHQLVDLGVLVEDDMREQEQQRSANSLSLLEWATLKMSQAGGCLPVALQQDTRVPEQLLPEISRRPSRALPEPPSPEAVNLWDTLAMRRSGRTGPKRAIMLTELSLLLHYSMRVQFGERETLEVSYRPVASGGARHPIDVFIVALRVSDLDEGIYRYNPLLHELTAVDAPKTTAVALSHAAFASLGDGVEVLPAITLFFTAVPARTARKYIDMALALIMKDVGCITQQIYVLIQGLGLTGCAVGTAEPAAIEHGLRLQVPQEVFVGGFAVW
jgi:SagB-type dehydrogenase family enzyme